MGLKKGPGSVHAILDNYKLCQTHQAGNCLPPFHMQSLLANSWLILPSYSPSNIFFLNFTELSPHSTETNLTQKYQSAIWSKSYTNDKMPDLPK